MTTLDRDLAQLKFVDLHGYRMAYREWGDPAAMQTLVLIHGITSSSLSWIRVAPRLATRSRVLVVDLKGHGDSDRCRSSASCAPSCLAYGTSSASTPRRWSGCRTSGSSVDTCCGPSARRSSSRARSSSFA
ncbi:MAG: alpha/beta hydrolase [Chloroflexi bacterium]|nr:MAG: alpha/beta hydrolase [Chloroflexota bacterium]